MQQDETKHSEQLDIEELEDVAGGTCVVYPVNGKMERVPIFCPVCGSGNIYGVFDGKEFSEPLKFQGFLRSKTLKCGACNHSGLAGTFRFNPTPV